MHIAIQIFIDFFLKGVEFQRRTMNIESLKQFASGLSHLKGKGSPLPDGSDMATEAPLFAEAFAAQHETEEFTVDELKAFAADYNPLNIS